MISTSAHDFHIPAANAHRSEPTPFFLFMPEPPACEQAAVSAAVSDMLRSVAEGHDAVASIDAALGTFPPLPHHALDIEIEDWDILLRAVKLRLRLAVCGLQAALPEPQAPPDVDAARKVQVIVLECVAALEQLHTALTQERGRRDER